jgi:ADP-ribosylglycohydrolase
MEVDNSDKIRGMFVGHFLGDALGAPYERRPKPEINENIAYQIRNFNRYIGKYKK